MTVPLLEATDIALLFVTVGRRAELLLPTGTVIGGGGALVVVDSTRMQKSTTSLLSGSSL